MQTYVWGIDGDSAVIVLTEGIREARRLALLESAVEGCPWRRESIEGEPMVIIVPGQAAELNGIFG